MNKKQLLEQGQLKTITLRIPKTTWDNFNRHLKERRPELPVNSSDSLKANYGIRMAINVMFNEIKK